jgi:hypothetical protein
MVTGRTAYAVRFPTTTLGEVMQTAVTHITLTYSRPTDKRRDHGVALR